MRKQSQENRWNVPFLFIFLLAAAALACNAPLNDAEPSPTSVLQQEEEGDTPTPEPIATSEPDSTPGSPATVPVLLETPAATEPPATPTNTATFEIPTLAPTVTPSHTPTRRPLATRTREGTTTPETTETPGSAGPLTFHFEIVWRLHPTIPTESIATVTVFAEGGEGGYRYYVGCDNSSASPCQPTDEVEGPIFEYTWRNCMGNPQSLTVTSADGQSLTVNYYENPPCPTPTPTP